MIARAAKYGVEMDDDTFEWYDDHGTAVQFSKMKRSGLEPTGRVSMRTINVVIKEEWVNK